MITKTNYEREEAKIERHITALYNAPLSPHYPYHNLAHTKMVVRYSQMIATFYNLGRPENFTLTAAAWFHDIGQIFGSMLFHEEASVKMWNEFAEKTTISSAVRQQVSQCILATKFPPSPSSLLEKIICDADTFHFGTVYFRETDALVKKELEIRTNEKVSDWIRKSIDLLQSHRFYTEYCQALLDNGKLNNIHWLQTLLKNEEPDS
ncbi:HD domain-containing protein [Pinibacter aurantiacus]|uniref:HD domain-containing protein n=1 Tax=Pinibacter aurantiacus TaxID=2851599 RepID=A0A9E2SGR1_9BACT|nr:HD domain-containing protein [Pinibacter aurantiacus]MBV4360445.1 HD domain-containing protein [Pinibacter aurantiacus]